MKTPVLELEFADDLVKKMRIPAADKSSLPDAVRRYNETVMEWYHERGAHQDLSADDLLGHFPTFIVRVAGFILEVQSGGEKYPSGFSVAVFSPKGVVVDERNFLDPYPGEVIPQKWGHGAPVVDGRKPVEISPVVSAPSFTFRVGSFSALVYDVHFTPDVFCALNLRVSRMTDDMAVYVTSYFWHYLDTAKYPVKRALLDGTPIIDARNPMKFSPANPLHPPFIPPQ